MAVDKIRINGFQEGAPKVFVELNLAFELDVDETDERGLALAMRGSVPLHSNFYLKFNYFTCDFL